MQASDVLPAGGEGEEVQLSSAPRQVAEVSTSGRSHILMSAISSDGSYIALGDAEELQLLRLEAAGEAMLLSEWWK